MIDLFSRLDKYMNFKGLNDNKITIQTGISNGIIGKARRRGSLSQENISKILHTYKELDANWLFTGNGKMLKNNSESNIKEASTVYNKTPKVIEINPESKSNTLIADIKASAGFGTILDNPKRLEELPSISLPNAPSGLNIAFQIDGDSMHPTIRHLDFVAGNQITDPRDIRDGYTYIILDKDDGVLCKRLYKEGADFKIVSDNPTYTPYKRSQNDILAFFKCFMRLSTDFRTYHDDVRNAIDKLNLRIDSIETRLNP